MKKRQGFVSNSSSSSFIAIFAEVTTDKARKIAEELGLEIMDYDRIKHEAEWGLGADWAGVWIEPKFEEGKEYIYHYNCCCDDSDFWTGGEYDYSGVDLTTEYFEDNDIKIVEIVNEENGFTKIEWGYGAGRNG